MAARQFVWAVDEDGKPCKCFAKPENRGKKNCNHKFHAEPGQSPKEFFAEHGMKLDGFTKQRDSIFQAEKVEVLPYRMTEEEKEGMLKISTKKDLLKDCDNGAYIELEEPLWNDMDKNAFSQISGLKSKDINSVLYEEKYLIVQSNEEYKEGAVVDPGDLSKEEIKSLADSGIAVTGVSAMNAYAKSKGFEATKDIYVLPYYMRQGTPDGKGGEINSDETDNYLHIFATKSYSMKNRQKSYDALINTPSKNNRNVYRRSTLSDRLSGKKGVWRKEITGCTIPYTGRAVAVPDVSINYDEVRIPPTMAVDIFRPTIQNHLKEKGFEPEQIKEIISSAKVRQENVSPITMNLIQEAMDEGNVRVIMNRQPSLHSASMQGFKPKLTKSYTVGANPLVAKGFGLDHDGDTCALIGINSSYIAEKVDKELHPSNFKYTPRKQDDLMMKPTKDALFGIMSVLKKRSN